MAKPATLMDENSVGGQIKSWPERTKGFYTDVRTEIWSLGVMAYEMVTGDLPFRGETHGAVATAILHRQPELGALRRAAGPQLSEVIRRCLHRWPQDRYASVTDLARELARVRRELAAAIVNSGWGLLELRPMRMSLEEIFLHLTTEETASAAAESREVSVE